MTRSAEARRAVQLVGWRFIIFTFATVGVAVGATIAGANWFFAGFAYGMAVMYVVHLAATAGDGTEAKR